MRNWIFLRTHAWSYLRGRGNGRLQTLWKVFGSLFRGGCYYPAPVEWGWAPNVRAVTPPPEFFDAIDR